MTRFTDANAYIKRIINMSESNLFVRSDNPVNQHQCFVMMPFASQYLEIYTEIIKPLLSELGFTCIRADELYGSRSIIQDMWHNIQISGLILADMSDKNPNVFYELGLAHAIGKKVILITQSIEDVPFDLRYLRCIVYTHNVHGMIKLREELRKTITNDPHIYAKIPVDILTDRFIGGFVANSIDFSMSFTGVRGQSTEISETYSITAEHDNFYGFYKKVQTSGQLVSAYSNHGSVDIKQLFVGMYLLSITIDKKLSIGEKSKIKLTYLLENNFPENNESWFYNADVITNKLNATFVFSSDLNVNNFSVYKKMVQEIPVVNNLIQTTTDEDNVLFKWSAENIAPPDCFVFRWNW